MLFYYILPYGSFPWSVILINSFYFYFLTNVGAKVTKRFDTFNRFSKLFTIFFIKLRPKEGEYHE